MNREPNHPDLENPPYCKATIEYGDNFDQVEFVEGFVSIQYLYPDEAPNRLSVVYHEHQDSIPEDAEWLGDNPGSTKAYELIFHDARVKEVIFEETWDDNGRPGDN